ncbi:MAG: dGTP triphosphohydrolase [Verrucomicrobiota bacterium]
MAANSFYNDFDKEPLLGGNRPQDYRTPFQIDRDRIIHSSAFRKLQSKTQVYLSGEYDFYRTRLTHSIEVAQIGRSICNALAYKSEYLNDDYFIDADLVEACCLSHDLGHPPFGHGGERTLHRIFQAYGGFEGNAQTLRLITDTLYESRSGQQGMAPTRAFADSVLKYKNTHSELENPRNHFLYDFQLPYRDFVHAGVDTLQGNQKAGAFRNLSSIECQIMDWSDDTAYCINDVVDGVKAGFLTVERLERWAERKGLDAEMQGHFDRFLADIRRDKIEAIFARKIGDFISACQLVETENEMTPLSNRYKYRLKIDGEVKSQAKFYKKVAVDLIFRSLPLQQTEYKGDRILEAIFKSIEESHLSDNAGASQVIPDVVLGYFDATTDEEGPWILARDYLASLTDKQALRIYKRLYDPEYASMVDLD